MRVRFWGTRGSIPVALTTADIRDKLARALVAASGRRFDSYGQVVGLRARWGQVLHVKTRPADALRRKGKGIEGGDDSVTPAGPGPAAGQQTGRDNNENDSLNHSLEDTLPSWPRKRAHGRETRSRRSPSRAIGGAALGAQWSSCSESRTAA